jgi:diguanylate cyclase (GGDEF)-like protein
MGDMHRPRFVVPTQGGRSLRARAPGGLTAGSPSGDQRFRAVFEHAPLGIALSSLDGRFTDVNLRFREVLTEAGIDPDDAGLADLARHLPDGGDEARLWLDGLAEVLAGRAPVARAELAMASPEAPPRWVQVTTALVVLGDQRHLLSHLEDITGRRLAEQRLTRLALHDGLTGLANRSLLEDRLTAALAQESGGGPCTGVLYLDLDDVKSVNDAFGHDVGDRVLLTMAHRLTHLLRAGDTAGRLGSDEFLMIVPGIADEVALGELTRRVDAALAEPLSVEPLAVRTARLVVTASVGATLTRPGDTFATAVRRADRAMFRVKRRRRSALDVRVADVRAAGGETSATERLG